jgi:hypothetical protein
MLVLVEDAAEALASSDVEAGQLVWSRRRWFQIKVRSNSSRRQVCTHRSMIEFIFGI